ncbi:MAG: carboxypeptidase regulatory-like domain-containing protein [Terracidiphilus sp.]|jgi:hypothetical protein
MAEIRWSGAKLLALGALLALAGAARAAEAQLLPGGPGGSIAGRLTDLHSAPLEGVSVTVRNQATGAETRTTTARNGTYKLSGLNAGEYTLEAESPQLGHGRLEGIFVSAGHEARLQTAMQFEISPPKPIQAVFHSIDTVTPPVSADFAAEPPQTLPLDARRVPPPAREMPRTVAPVLTADLAAEPLHALPLPARPWPSSVQMPVAAVPARIEAAVQVVPAAVQLFEPPPKPAQAASVAGDPVAPVVTTTVAATELQALPASGRRWQDFVLDTPTAAAPADGASQTSLRGAAQEPAEIAMDGASIRLAFGGSGGSGSNLSGPGSNRQGGSEQTETGQAWAGGHGFVVSEAAIREVQMAAGNVEAESERAAGGRVNVETQRGANGLHGQGFLFDRQNTWGAQNPFTQWVKETAPATELATPTFTSEPYTPPDHETVWGFGLGSQMRRDKLFWFAALDSYRRNDPGLATVKNPGVFFAQPSACDTACPTESELEMLSTRLGSSNNPLAAGVAAYSSVLEKLAGLLGPAPRTASQWVGFSRIDWQAAERHRLTLEGIGAAWDSPGGGLTRLAETYGNHSFGSSHASEEWLLGRWEAFLTPNLLAVTQGSAGHDILSARPDAPSTWEQTFLSPNLWGQLPQIVVDSRYGLTIGNPARFGQGSYPDERLYQAQESLDWVRGGLLVKAGFDFSHNSDATSMLRNQTGTYTYANAINFASDALVFQNFQMTDQLDPRNQHNCDATGKGFGYLPCYSYYSQLLGPTHWWLSTNDWAGYATAQWQAGKLFVLSAGLRWEREQLPPPIAKVNNPELPLTEKLPNLGNNWGPRLSLAVGNSETHWPVLRLGYGMYFGRTENATIETALTQTGSLDGDLNFFLRPTDNLHAGGAPPFPDVLSGEPSSVVKPDAVEFAPAFHNPELHQAVAAIEENLPGHLQLTASALVSLGRRLPVSIDTNLDLSVAGTITYAVCDESSASTQCGFAGLGPIKTSKIKVPFYASWPSTTEFMGSCATSSAELNDYTRGWLCPDYQQINQIASKANSTYEAAMLKLVRYGRRGLSLHAHYTYSHAMDWNPNASPFDPADFSQEYGTSDLDVRHSAAAMAIYETPWKLRNWAARVGNGWMLSGIGQFRSGLPYTMRVAGSLPECFVSAGITPCTTPYAGLNAAVGDSIVGLAPGINGSGGDNRVIGVGRNTYRYPSAWKADLRLGKSFDLGPMRKLELLAESFNLFNHQNVTELETTGYYLESGSQSGSPPTLNFLTGLKANTTAFGQPLNVNATNFYRERQIQIGLRMRF